MSERIDRGVVAMDDGKVRVDDEIFDQVILATGMSAAPGQTELYKQIEAELGVRMVDRYPLLDDKLSWMDGEDLYVVGANAVLELGPGALNLMGAMRGAKIVAESLRDLMWRVTSPVKAASASALVAANQFSLLGLEDDSDGDESDDDGDDADGESGIGDATKQAEELPTAIPAAPRLRASPDPPVAGCTSPFRLPASLHDDAAGDWSLEMEPSRFNKRARRS